MSGAILRRVLPKKDFARNLSILVGGTSAAQLLMILAAPLLTRLFAPEDFGVLAVYGSLLALIGVFASLRYELAIPLPEDDAEAASVAVLSLLLVALTTVLSGALVALLGTAIAEVLGLQALAGYLWLLPAGVLLSGTYNVLCYWSVRNRRFSAIARARICQSVVTLIIQFAAFKLGGLALMLGQVAGQGAGAATLARPALAMSVFRLVSWGGVWKATVRYRRFPVFSSGAGFANIAGLQLLPILLVPIFGAAIVGLYALAYRILALPMSLVGGAVGQVLFSSAAESYRTDKLGFLVIDIYEKLSRIGLPATLMLVLAGPYVFGIVFGEEWAEAGQIASWMAPWFYFQFVSSPLSAAIFSATERQQYMLAFQIVMFVLRLLAIASGVYFGEFITVIIFFSFASSISYAGLLGVLARLSRAPLVKILKSTASSLCLSCAIVFPLFLASAVPTALPNQFFLGLFISTILYFLNFLSMLRRA